MKTNIKINLLALGVCLASTACSPLAPRPDDSKFFILNPISDGAAAAVSPVSATQSLTIGIGPIEFPDYLRRLEVVTRTSANELDLSSDKRWGEPLDRNFARVLSENLSQLLNTQQLERYPWSRRTEVDYQVSGRRFALRDVSGRTVATDCALGHQGWPHREGPLRIRDTRKCAGRPRRNRRISRA